MKIHVLVAAAVLLGPSVQQPAPGAASSGTADDSVVAGPRAGRAGRRGPRQAGDHRLHAAEHDGADDRRDHRPGRQLPAALDEPRGARAGQLPSTRWASRRSCCVTASAPSIAIRSSSATPARHSHRSIARRRVAHRSGSHRLHGVLGGRTPGVLGVDAFRRGQPGRGRSDRSRQQPAGLRGARRIP